MIRKFVVLMAVCVMVAGVVTAYGGVGSYAREYASSQHLTRTITQDELALLVLSGDDTKIQYGGVAITIPIGVLAALYDAENAQSITVSVAVTQPTASQLENGKLLAVSITLYVGNGRLHDIEIADAITIALSLEDFSLEELGFNPHKIASWFGEILMGGRYNAADNVFVAQTRLVGEIVIAYTANLARVSLNLASHTIYALSSNIDSIKMDVLPIIQNGGVLLPVRFLAYALGAEITWTDATDYEPLIVHLVRGDTTLSFGIGEMSAELEGFGMDVPAQIVDGRVMVPLRFVGGFFHATTDWDGNSRSIEVVWPLRP